MAVHSCADIDAAMELADHISAGDVVLVKASRAERLDILASSLLETLHKREVME